MGSWWSFTALTSAPEEVQDVGECTGIGLVDLGVRALRARDRGELLVLDVEELCQAAPGGGKLICLELAALAFRASPIPVFQFSSPPA